jgi:hypothetical protein
MGENVGIIRKPSCSRNQTSAWKTFFSYQKQVLAAIVTFTQTAG